MNLLIIQLNQSWIIKFVFRNTSIGYMPMTYSKSIAFSLNNHLQVASYVLHRNRINYGFLDDP